MYESIVKGLFLVGMIAAYFIRFAQVRKAGAGRGSASSRFNEYVKSGMEWLPLLLDFAGRQLVPLIYIFTPWLSFADYQLPSIAFLVLTLAGAALFVIAMWLLWRSHADLGKNWTPAVEHLQGQRLVTEGVYHRIRHPMYAAHWLWSIAQLLLLHNWVAGLASVVCFIPFTWLRVTAEEKMMLESFGEEYRVYMQRTGRFLPRF